MTDRTDPSHDVPAPPLARETPAPPGYVPPLEDSPVLADLEATAAQAPPAVDEPDADGPPETLS